MDLDGFGDVFQVFAAESFHAVAVPQALSSLGADQDLASLSNPCQPGGQVRHRAAGREGSAGASQSLEASRTDQRGP